MLKQYFDFANVDKSLLWKLVGLHVVIIALANYTVQFGGTLPLIGAKFTWGMFVFPLIVVATDLTVRMTNKYLARSVVAMAFVPAIIVSAWIASPMIGFASALAYLLGQLLDVSVFQRIREKWTETWWVAPAISTVFANILDTYAFFYAAFANNTDIPFMQEHWLEIANTDVVFKIIVSFVLFLPVYGVLLAWLKNRVIVEAAK